MTSNRRERGSSCRKLSREYFVLRGLPFVGSDGGKSIGRPEKFSKIISKFRHNFHQKLTFPCPDRSKSIKPFSVPISKLTPQSAAQRISELKRFLYLRISGVSLVASCCDVGVTLTFTWLSLRDAPPELPAPKPNVRKLRCFCWKASECGCIKWVVGWGDFSLFEGEWWFWARGEGWKGADWGVFVKDLVGVERVELTAARY